LQQLVGLVQTAIEDYRIRSPGIFATTREMENAAFHHYGLQDIEAVLDHVADTANSIHSLDAVIQQANTVDYTITPPQPGATPDLSPGGGTFQERRTEPRLKTALFVLQQDFGVDVYDPEQLTLTAGAVPDRMMRRASYYQVIAPRLERMLLVCDESENITYVLNMAILADLGTSNERIARMTRAELNDLLNEHHQLGQRIKYHSQHVVSRLRTAVQEDTDHTVGTSYLYPNAAEGVLSIREFAR
jgi:hypothetical protein